MGPSALLALMQSSLRRIPIDGAAASFSPAPPDGLLGMLQASSSSPSCHYEHDATAFYLSLLILIGLICSYLPQHYRIISSRSSEGFSPWFLLLGATSSASSLFNVLTLQWGVVRCCRLVSAGTCVESLLGILQVFFQWACFNIVLILFIIYFPRNKRYVRAVPVEVADLGSGTSEEDILGGPGSFDPLTGHARFNPLTRASSRFLSRFFSRTKASSRSGSLRGGKTGPGAARRHSEASETSLLSSSDDASSFDPANVLPPSATRAAPLVLSPEYSLSIILAIVVLIHLILSLIVTLGLLLALPKATSHEPTDSPPSDDSNTLIVPLESHAEHLSVVVLRLWAYLCGVLSMVLACAQYLPQIVHTARLRLVGSLSIPMMCIQTPGSFVFVYSLAVRPGVDWSTWLVYIVTGMLQGVLLGLCIAWKFRQRAMGVDDWGHDKHHASLLREEAEAAYTPVEGVSASNDGRFPTASPGGSRGQSQVARRGERTPLLDPTQGR